MERTLWAAMQGPPRPPRVADRPDAELAQTFFNSVTRRVFSTVGVDAAIEYLDPPTPSRAPPSRRRDDRPATGAGIDDGAVPADPRADPSGRCPMPSSTATPTLVAGSIADALGRQPGWPARSSIDMRPLGLLPEQGRLPRRPDPGRRRASSRWCCPLLHAERGIVVDAVLMTQNEASVVFGFSWTYFRVDAPRPRALVEFLGSIMPLKRVDELYNAIGYNKHGKTELYRNLMALPGGARRPLRLRRGRRGHGDGGVHPARLQRGLQDHQGQLRRAQEHHPPGGDGQVPFRVRARPGGPAGRRAGVRAPGVPPPLLPRRPARVPAPGGRRDRAGGGGPGDRAAPLHRAAGDAAQPLPAGRRGRGRHARR